MPLVAPHQILARAFLEHWAVGAFNTSNLEVTQAIVWAFRDARSPGIVQTSEAALQYAGVSVLRDLIRDVAAAVDVPVILHLDHGKSIEVARECVDAGYESVMIDGSALPLEENIALTKHVVAYAHPRGVWVEGEVGAIQGKEGLREGSLVVDENALTKPEDAERFVRETGVDALAVSVGTLHGAFRGEERLREERLKDIHGRVNIPLVLHGASGLPEKDLRRAIALGVAKVNIDTELREAFHDTLVRHKEGSEGHSIDLRKILSPARDAVQLLVKEKISILGSGGRV